MKTNSLDFDAQALREKILDLAMRGKLVPQDPNDEPASVLLEKIKAEKEQLIKEKKIKKTKPLAPITDDEKPFNIPDSWEWVRLGDVISTINGDRGKNYPGKKYWQTSGVPFLNAACLTSNKYIDETKFNYISKDRYNLLKSGFVKKDDILYCIRGSLGKIGLVNISIGAIASSLIILRKVNEEINVNFLYYVLDSSINAIFIKEHKNGSAQPNIPGKDLMTMVMPWPPLEEQSRIAAKIAQLFALLRKIESSTQQYAKLQTLLKSKVLDLAMRGKLVKQDPNDEPASVLLKKIEAEKEQLTKEKKIKKSKPLPPITDKEKPFEIPDSWEWVRLGDIVSSVTKGTTPKGGKKAYVSKGINYYRAENVAISGLGKQNLNHITSDIHNGPLKRSILKENDILITIAGTLGRVTYVKKEDLPGNTNQAVSISRPINSNEINEKFLVYILASSIQRVVKNNKTTSIPNLTLQQIAETIFPFPPLSEQNRIVSKIVRLFTLLKK